MPTAVVLAAVSAVGLFAWMTRQPDHPVFERVASVPIVGGVFDEVRRPFLGRPALNTASKSQSKDLAGVPEEPDGSDREWIGTGAHLYATPGRGELLMTTTTLASYDVLERRGSWLQLVLPDGTSAWLNDAEPRDLTPPLGEAALPPGPLHSRPIDPAQFEIARAHLRGSARRVDLAGYSIWTDLPQSQKTRDLLDAARTSLSSIERTYTDLYGVVPVGVPRETVILYATYASYRALQSQTDGIAGTASAGHTSGGMAALAAAGRPPWEVEATLVHEIGHLLSRRAIGPGLQPWLTEGLADHLALLRGRPYPERDDRFRVVELEQIRYTGPLASLRLLAELAESGELLGLQQLTVLEQELFLNANRAPLLYAQSALWIDHLLQDPSTRVKFHAFLSGVARGEQATGHALREHLGGTWDELDARFRTWLVDRRDQTIAAGW